MSKFKYGKLKLTSTFLFIKLGKKYNNCESCGSEKTGEDEGSMHFDGVTGHFKRTCKCGWEIELVFEKVE
ncbi:DUF3797 domain-containing protein [Paenibacillus sp. N1-5-1-14]|uniref:DUF3797 domain-containing protein n=1 Tax=Paenibacillus radicibacter TaxID=2972488 RepID=UPI0021599D17|nr:DUF3797 domain-containing protein [Paenibacillus radicibacter]MCR8641397.1 DUF3797 domain-containing protein [Paenibacillus radicibacter]